MTLVDRQLLIFIVFKKVLHFLCKTEGKKIQTYLLRLKKSKLHGYCCYIHLHNSVTGL